MTTKVKTINKVNLSQLKKGSILSETQYYTVEKVVGEKVQLKTDNDELIVIDKNYLPFLNSADQYIEMVKVSKTEATNIFLSNPNIAMEVNFNKQVKETDVVKELMEAYEGSTIKSMEAAFKKTIKKALSGEERTIRGRHNGNQDEFGRVHFTDMEIEKNASSSYDVRHRLVDPRTLNYLIVNGIKYVVK